MNIMNWLHYLLAILDCHIINGKPTVYKSVLAMSLFEMKFICIHVNINPALQMPCATQLNLSTAVKPHFTCGLTDDYPS